MKSNASTCTASPLQNPNEKMLLQLGLQIPLLSTNHCLAFATMFSFRKLTV